MLALQKRRNAQCLGNALGNVVRVSLTRIRTSPPRRLRGERRPPVAPPKPPPNIELREVVEVAVTTEEVVHVESLRIESAGSASGKSPC